MKSNLKSGLRSALDYGTRIFICWLAIGLAMHGRLCGDITEIGSGDGYVIGINESRQFVVISVGSAEYDNWLRGPTFTQRQLMANRIYEHLSDSFDMLAFVADEPMGIPDVTPYGGIHFSVSNDIAGIGRPIFNNSNQYGSDGRLQSFIYLTSYAAFRFSLLHEITHRWANGLTIIPSTPYGGHFGYSSVGGVLGGWEPGTLMSTGGNTYDADGPSGSDGFGIRGNSHWSVDFGELELYLAGLIGPQSVSDLEVAVNPTTINVNFGTFQADGIVTYTINDIIAAEGARIPDVANSQKHFQLLAIVVTDEPLPQFPVETEATFDMDLGLFALDESDMLNEIGRSANFWEATGGRATLSFLINLPIAPESFTVTRGIQFSGGLEELADSDDRDLVIRRATIDIQSRTEFDIKAISPTDTPIRFEFTLEASVFARSLVTQSIFLYDYTTEQFEQVDSRDAQRFSDQVTVAIPTGDLSRFVQTGTHCIEARIQFQSANPRQQFSSNVDQTAWAID